MKLTAKTGKGEAADLRAGGRSKRSGSAEPPSGAKKGRRKSKSTAGAIIELVVIVVVALGLALGIQAFIIKPYKIPSGSMEPTLAINQR
ncbi:MAG TPA: S26 family signal peptidase, partial [Solirubrobacteraceae bacterium]|nr:S26 family signal peptidase [Solirubrobacteraceae bacterium]